MMPLVAHELRKITRRAAWPIALSLHLLAATAFVVVWGPTGGVPLWSASALAQLAAADRVFLAVLFTWLATHVVAADSDNAITDWCAVTARPPQHLFAARSLAAVFLGAGMVATAAPPFVAAQQMSSASAAEMITRLIAATGFAVLCAGVTAAAAIAVRSPLGIWCTAMVVSLTAATAVRTLDTAALRAIVPATLGALAIVAASRAAGRRWFWRVEAQS